MRTFLHLLFAVAMFAAAIASESHSSDLLKLDGDGWYSWQVEGIDDLQIYARVESGHPTRLIVPAWQCGHRKLPEAQDLGVISASDSVDWLRRFVDADSDINSELLFTIVAHDDDVAYDYIEHLILAEN